MLVTGASGFVGTALVRALASRRNMDVVAAVRSNVSKGSTSADLMSAGPAAAVHQSDARNIAVGDISGPIDWTAALDGVHSVVHLAARVHVMQEVAHDPLAEFRRVNVDATLRLARQASANGVKRFVFLSSIKVNGESGVFTEQDTPAPADAYGISKCEAEAALRDLARTTQMELVIVRPPLVYGPGVKANFRALVRMVQRGVPLPLGAINNRRSFVALDNLVDLLMVCVQHPSAAGQTFFVSDGHDLSTTELLKQIGIALEKPARLLPVPAWFLSAAFAITGRSGLRERLLGTLAVDVSKARDLLQWSPPLTVGEGLRRTVRAL